jgi:hypothetical protein
VNGLYENCIDRVKLVLVQLYCVWLVVQKGALQFQVNGACAASGAIAAHVSFT